jgi:hypothetical protein
VGCAFGLQLAHAEIFTWTDASGKVNVSNLAPPEGVTVTRVTPAPPPRIAMAADAAREAARQAEMVALAERARELEMQLLSERVRHLEREVELSRSEVPPEIAYPSSAVAPTVQYIVEAPPPPSPGCDPAGMGCGLWWGTGFYPASVVVASAPNLHRSHRLHAGQHHAGHRPTRAPGPWIQSPGQSIRLPAQPMRLPGITRGVPRRR